MSYVSDGGSYAWEITNNGNTYGPAYMVGGTLSDGIYPQLSIGNVISKQLDLNMWNAAFDATQPIALTMHKVAVDGSVEKNLLGFVDRTLDYQGITYAFDASEGTITLSGIRSVSTNGTTALQSWWTLKAGTYCLSDDLGRSDCYIKINDYDGNQLVIGNGSFTTTVDKQVRLFVQFIGAVNLSTSITFKPQLESGSTPTMWVPYTQPASKGTYFIDTLDASPYDLYCKLTAFDALLKAEVPYMKTGTWTATTDYAIVTQIANDIGVSINSETLSTLSNAPKTIDQAPSLGENGSTDRDLLSVVGIMRGGNWIINDNNELELVPLSGRSGDPIVIGDEVNSFDISPVETVTRVELWAGSSKSYRSPDNLTEQEWEALGGAVISASMPIMASQELADALYTQYHGLTYIPFKANEVYLGPETELGEKLTIKDATVVLSKRTINLDPLASCDLEADATQAVASYYPYLSPVEREIKQDVIESKASITVAEDRIDAEVVRAEGAEKALGTRIDQTASTWEVKLQNYIDSTEDYMKYESGVLTLGESDSSFKAQLSNTELAFTGSDNEKAAWISNTQLNIKEAVIRQDEKFVGSSGNWVQQVVNDHFQIKWVAN